MMNLHETWHFNLELISFSNYAFGFAWSFVVFAGQRGRGWGAKDLKHPGVLSTKIGCGLSSGLR